MGLSNGTAFSPNVGYGAYGAYGMSMPYQDKMNQLNGYMEQLRGNNGQQPIQTMPQQNVPRYTQSNNVFTY